MLLSRSEESAKKQAVQNLFDSGRVYFFPAETEVGFVLTTNLSTAILTCLQDLRNRERLEHIIDIAMEYPITTIDTEVLELISKIRKDFDPKEHNDNKYTYNLLAFYCYMADMVTLYPNHANSDGSNKTFLEACRDARETGKTGRAWLEEVISILRLTDKLPKDFIHNWHWHWSFSAFGEINSADNIDTAAYNQLARAISFLGGAHIGVGECICFARGNRDYFEKNNPYITQEPNLNEMMLNRARELAQSQRMLPHLVQTGKKIREDKLHDLVRDNTNLHVLEATGQNEFNVDFGKGYMRNLLMNLPLETLELLDKSDFAIAHVNDYNLSRIYPKDTLPGLSEDQMIDGRLAAGDTLSRFRLICNSNGFYHHEQNNPIMGEVIKQRLIHETAHIAFGNHGARNIDGPYSNLGYATEFKDLSKKFSDICGRLFKEQDPALDQESQLLRYKTYDGHLKQRTLRDVINAKSTIGTYSPPERAEEMMVECLALLYTEYSDPNKPNNIFQNYRSDNPVFAEFQSTLHQIKDLYCKVSQTMVQEAERLRQHGGKS